MQLSLGRCWVGVARGVLGGVACTTSDAILVWLSFFLAKMNWLSEC